MRVIDDRQPLRPLRRAEIVFPPNPMPLPPLLTVALASPSGWAVFPNVSGPGPFRIEPRCG
jgi:hypothetical protein